MAIKTIAVRSLDIFILLASNAFTACAAALIAFGSSSGEAKAFFPTQDLALYALIATLSCVAIAAAIWGGHSYKVRKLLTQSGYRLFPRRNEKPWESLPDLVLRKNVHEAMRRKNADMQSVCLATSLATAGMIAAMYLSNTGTTSGGWIAGNVAFAAYAFPGAVLLIFMALGVSLFLRGRKLAAGANNWISMSSRPPKKVDIQPGFIPDLVLCRSSIHLNEWGGRYRVIKISHIKKHMPPKSSDAEIDWVPIPL